MTIPYQWFKHKGWQPLPFQEEAWKQFAIGKSGIIAVPTGAGKTYAIYLPALDKLHHSSKSGTQILYISPLRALAKDMETALQRPIDDLNLPYRVEKRTGDTTISQRNKQTKKPPEILLTTPESLSVLLSRKEAHKQFAHLQTIIVDEWHELLGSKRGVLLELCLARLKTWNPQTQIWGLTATIGNINEAAQACVGIDRKPVIITTSMKREVNLEAVLPETIEKLPWAGQLGLRQLPNLLERLSPDHSTLIFTNTRSQAERWHRALIEAKPEWENLIALHHSSVDKKLRERIEEQIKDGQLRFVVCTSSLDLGIDLPAVERVFQIGSPKSVARLLQRAGRSFHKPLAPCHIAIVPTHALEVMELKGYRLAVAEHKIEDRKPLRNSYDVLIQHLVTCAISQSFNKTSMWEEIKKTYAYADLTLEEYEQCLQFLTTGGRALTAYPEYKKLLVDSGIYSVDDPQIIRRHRMNIGTITADSHVLVKFAKGSTLGMVEEAFLTNMNPGDHFLFAGKRLELVQYRDMIAYVRLAKGETIHAAVWQGSRLPFSAPLGQLLRRVLDKPGKEFPEDQFLESIGHLQSSLSALPHEDEMLIELLHTREGFHLFAYPFEGKTIHQGLALLVAHRLAKRASHTFTISVNDYGFEILSRKPFDETLLTPDLFTVEGARLEIQELVNLHEAGKRYFRDIARIAGLVFQGYPGKHKSNRQLQMSSGLLYDVFSKYDPENLLLRQAKKETLEQQLEQDRLEKVLIRLSGAKIVIKALKKFSPFSLPLYIERVSERLSTESLAERIENIKASW